MNGDQHPYSQGSVLCRGSFIYPISRRPPGSVPCVKPSVLRTTTTTCTATNLLLHMSLDLSLTPVIPSALTESALEDLIRLGIALVDTLPSRTRASSAPADTKISWTAGKGDGETKIWKATHNSEPWIARVTDLAGIGYAELWRHLVVEKSATEKAALMQPHDEIEALGPERTIGDTKVSGMLIPLSHARAPSNAHTRRRADVHKLLHVQAFSAREFIETVVYKDLPQPDGTKCCIVITLPLQGAIRNPAHAHGAYTSVETIREVGDGVVEVVTALTVRFCPYPAPLDVQALTMRCAEQCGREHTTLDAEHGHAGPDTE